MFMFSRTSTMHHTSLFFTRFKIVISHILRRYFISTSSSFCGSCFLIPQFFTSYITVGTATCSHNKILILSPHSCYLTVSSMHQQPSVPSPLSFAYYFTNINPLWNIYSSTSMSWQPRISHYPSQFLQSFPFPPPQPCSFPLSFLTSFSHRPF